MAEAERNSAAATPARFGAVLALLVALSAAAGAAAGLVLLDPRPTDDPGTATKRAAAPAADGKPRTSEPGHRPMTDEIIMLEPILVTIAGTPRTQLRMELGIRLGAEAKYDRSVMTKALAEDVLRYLRTLTLAQLETAADLEFVHEDLSEIVRARAKQPAAGIVIKSMMVE